MTSSENRAILPKDLFSTIIRLFCTISLREALYG